MSAADPRPADSSDAKIVDSWRKNASPWTAAVRDGQIASRRLVTDRALTDTVARLAPRTVLDVGCGEGWLARALAPMGIQVLGVDVVPALIRTAQQAGGGRFAQCSYEQIAGGELKSTADAVVCNFSLIGKDSVQRLLQAMPALLNLDGALIVQTLHPVIACGDRPYEDGWREGSWAGFGPEFVDPAPWYFRTLGGWLRLLQSSGLRLRDLQEPVHPQTGLPASLLMVAQTER